MKKKDVAFRLAGFVLIAGLIAMVVLVGTAAANGGAEIYGSRSFGTYEQRHNFTTTDNLYGYGDFGDYSYTFGGPPCPVGCGGRIYVVEHQESWENGTTLTDVSGGYETVAWGNNYFQMAWPKTLTPGTYDLILDLNVSGYYYVWTHIPNPYPGEDNITDPRWIINVTGPAEPGISITKMASPSAGAPSTNVNFSITVTNNGETALDPVKVVDSLPEGMSYVSSSPLADETSGPIVWNNVGSLASGDTKTLYLIAHIDVGSGTLNNTVNATGKPPTGDNVSDDGYAVVTAVQPSIQVTKTASPSSGAPSTNVNFSISVTNNGETVLDPVKVVDSLPAGMSYVDSYPKANDTSGPIVWNNVGSLASGDTKTLYLIAHIDVGSGTLNNTVNATGKPPTGDNVSDDGYAVVTTLQPSIQVTKTASPPSGAPSTNVNFSISVTNNGETVLDPVKVVDTLPTGMSYVDSFPKANLTSGPIVWNNVGSLTSGGTKTLYLIAHIDVGASGTLNNTVNATGKPPTGDNVSDEGYAVVTAVQPSIQVTKTASPTSGAPSTDVNFTIVVSNTGDCTLNPVKVVDTLPTGMSYVDSSPAADSQVGSTVTWNNLGSLSASESKTIYLIAHIDAGAMGILNNTANATGKPPAGDNVSDECYEEVTALVPGIQVTKVASPPAGAPSTDVNFTIVVSNTGDCTLDPVKVVDALPTWMSYVSSSPAADSQVGSTVTWSNVGPLSASDSKTIYLIAHIDAGVTGILNNTANATGKPPAGDNVSDEVYEEVTVLVPGIQVTKVASPSSGAPSTNVNFSIVVTNIGDCTLNPVKVVDTLPAEMSYVDSSPAADSQVGSTVTWNNLGPLSASESKTIYLIAHIDAGAMGILNNTANATGKPPAGDNVSDEVYEEVTALVPGIQVTKLASPPAGAPSTNVNFTIVVSNTGDCTLNPVTVVDTLPTWMSYVSDDSGGIESPTGTITWTNVGPLDSLADTTITMVVHIDTGASGTLTDTVTATGTPPAGDNVSDSDTADVEVLAEAGINVTKTASPTSGTPCTNVAFTITVTNTGNSTLDPVKVVDTLPTWMSYVSDDSGGIESPTGTITWAYVGPLNSLADTTITMVAHIDTGASGTLTDTVTATGTPPAGDNVSDSDTADVQAMNPSINITKTVDPPAVGPGMDVTFTINATNTGDCTLKSVQINESLPAGMSFVSSIPVPDTIIGGTLIWNDITGGAGLAPGATSTITMIVHIAEDAEGILRNVVVVNTTPPSPPTNDTENVTVADVEVNKSGTPSIVAPGGNVTYTITYINTGNATLTNVVIIEYYPAGVTFISASPAPDPGTNNVWTIGTLAVGASGEINVTVKVPESIDLTFAESGSVIGEGFVMISKELSTEQMPYTFMNVVTLSCTELGPVSDTATTTVSGVPGTSMSITEHGSGIYESDESLDLCTRNRSISIVKTTNAVYKPTTFNFSKSFVVNFTPKWKQDIETKNCVIGAVIRKLITDATYIEDETRSKADNTSTIMVFDSSFNGSLYIGARTNDTAISETYIGEFDVLQDIQIGKGPIPSPSPTPTPTWLPCASPDP